MHQFVPALFGRDVNGAIEGLVGLSAKLGGLAIKDPTVTGTDEISLMATQHLTNCISLMATQHLTSCILIGDPFDSAEHEADVYSTLREARKTRMERQSIESQVMPDRIVEPLERIMKRIIAGNASQWLSVIPLASDNLDLSCSQFRDVLAMRYGLEPSGLPDVCDSCGEQIGLTHGLNCKKGGLVKKGHDYVRDECAQLAEVDWGGVYAEPVVKEATDAQSALTADIEVHGVWVSGREGVLR